MTTSELIAELRKRIKDITKLDDTMLYSINIMEDNNELQIVFVDVDMRPNIKHTTRQIYTYNINDI